jgi:hypothetical protein
MAAALSIAASCSRGAAQGDIEQKPFAASAEAAPATVPHGNHDPKYGGVVLMNGDLHFEVVLGRNGTHRVYFSDAVREELPASIASAVTITVTRAGAAPETLALQIDESGESWVGRGRPVGDPAHANARIAYTVQSQAYWIDVPFEAR